MNSVSKGRKRPIFLNYKMYMPVVAAVLVFAVVVNKPEIIKKLGLVGNNRPAQEQTAIGNQTGEPQNNNISGEAGTASAETTGENSQKVAEGTSTPMQTPNIAANNTEGNTNKAGAAKVQVPKKGSDTNNGTKVAEADKKGSDENITTASEGDEKPIDIAGILGFVYLKDPEVNYEIVLTDKDSEIMNYINNGDNGKIVQDNIYKFSVDKFKPLDEMMAKSQIRKTTVNNIDESSKNVVLKVLFVNYEITISDNQPEVTQFISDNAKCKALGDNTYQLSTESFKNLDAMLANGKVDKKVINNINDESVIIKVLTVNYEIAVNSDQTEIVDFIKEKCFNIQDNIYEITSEDYKTFEEILNNGAIERKLINEPQDSNIVVRILIN
jgi:hypothetical protein